MRYIPLTQGQFAIVDDKDYPRLSKYSWIAQKANSGEGFYAVRFVKIEGLFDTDPRRFGQCKRILVRMPRQIMGMCADDPRIPDHRNHNKLDNRRENLRICTRQQNRWNTPKGVLCKNSQYKGVARPSANKWHTLFCGRYIGAFGSEVEAAKAYDEAASDFYGEYACLNFPIEMS